MRKNDLPAILIGIVAVFPFYLVVKVPHDLFFRRREMQRFIDLIVEKSVFGYLGMQEMPVQKIFMDEEDKRIFIILDILKLDHLPGFDEHHAAIFIIVFG